MVAATSCYIVLSIIKNGIFLLALLNMVYCC